MTSTAASSSRSRPGPSSSSSGSAAPKNPSSSSQPKRSRKGSMKLPAEAEFTQSEAYLLFKESVALQRIVLDPAGREIWEYYDSGPKQAESALVCLPTISGTADSFFLQILGLSAKGYRVVSCTPSGIYSTAQEWTKGFHRFLDGIHIGNCHILGAGLGGYLGLCYSQYKQKRVKSFILVNGFIDTQWFVTRAPYFGAFGLVPTFLLQKAVMSTFPKGPTEIRIVRSVDFMVNEVSKNLKPRDLISRLTIQSADGILQSSSIALEDRQITIIETLDDSSRSDHVKEENLKFFPGASQAYLKDGGEFPYLSRSSDFNLHVQVHMRKFTDLENRSALQR